MRAEDDPRRCIPVKLTSIPLDERLKAAHRIMHSEPPEEMQAILAAALWPSDETYWIAA
jgi:hypothetical protein